MRFSPSSLGPTEIKLDRSWHAKDGGSPPLPLAAGNHQVRFAFTAQDRDGKDPKEVRMPTNVVAAANRRGSSKTGPGRSKQLGRRGQWCFRRLSLATDITMRTIYPQLDLAVRNEGDWPFSVWRGTGPGELEIDGAWTNGTATST